MILSFKCGLVSIALMLSIFNGCSAGDDKKIYMRHELEVKANKLAENGKFEEAIEVYQSILDSKYINDSVEEGVARGGIWRCLIVLGRYEDALQAIEWHYKANPKKYEPYVKEFRALLSFQNNNDPTAVYEHIQYLRQLYFRSLPPNGFNDLGLIMTARILELYDAIGDYDAGIAFVNECIDYYRSNKLYEGSVFVEPVEYVKVREGFEQDKAEGKKGCIGKKPGEVCLGRATQAIIQSDYFPW